VLAILIAVSLTVAPEVELLGGYMGGGSNDPKAVALALRAGADFWDMVTVSGLLVTVPGPEGSYASGNSAGRVDPSGMSAWAVLTEMRAHTRGPLQLHAGIAAGIGKLGNWQCSDTVRCTENEVLHGHPALSVKASIGMRLLPPTWRGFTLGGEIAVPYWLGQEDPPKSRASPGQRTLAVASFAQAHVGASPDDWLSLALTIARVVGGEVNNVHLLVDEVNTVHMLVCEVNIVRRRSEHCSHARRRSEHRSL
jgi:hypothetical protein